MQGRIAQGCRMGLVLAAGCLGWAASSAEAQLIRPYDPGCCGNAADLINPPLFHPSTLPPRPWLHGKKHRQWAPADPYGYGSPIMMSPYVGPEFAGYPPTDGWDAFGMGGEACCGGEAGAEMFYAPQGEFAPTPHVPTPLPPTGLPGLPLDDRWGPRPDGATSPTPLRAQPVPPSSPPAAMPTPDTTVPMPVLPRSGNPPAATPSAPAPTAPGGATGLQFDKILLPEIEELPDASVPIPREARGNRAIPAGMFRPVPGAARVQYATQDGVLR